MSSNVIEASKIVMCPSILFFSILWRSIFFLSEWIFYVRCNAHVSQIAWGLQFNLPSNECVISVVSYWSVFLQLVSLKKHYLQLFIQTLHWFFIILDESQHKLVHAAKCLNSECDGPINIPWKQNCQVVRKPEKTAEKEDEETSGDFTNGHHEELKEIPQSVEEGLRCEECGTKFTENHVEKFIKAMEFTDMHLQNMKGASVACILLLTIGLLRVNKYKYGSSAP